MTTPIFYLPQNFCADGLTAFICGFDRPDDVAARCLAVLRKNERRLAAKGAVTKK